MNGLAILLAAASVGVDYGWQPIGDGQLEYIVQIEPALLDALAGGQKIESEIHPDARSVRRFRIQVGVGPLPREGASPQGASPQGASDSGSSGQTPETSSPPDLEKPARGGQSSLWAPQPPSVAERRPTPPTSLGTPLPTPPPLLTDPPAVEETPEVQPGGDPPTSPQPLWLDHPVQPPDNAREAPADVAPRAAAPPNAEESYAPAAPRDSAMPLLDPDAGAASGPSESPLATASHQDVIPPKGEAPEGLNQQRPSASPAEGVPEPGRAKSPQEPAAEGSDKPWLPLTITSLALFASVGANLYLAWIAWGFYVRHQKLAAQLQAAGSSAG